MKGRTKERPINGQVMGKPNLEVFSDTLIELAEVNPDLLVVTSDSRGSGKLVPFAARYPDRLVETGIAEQNLVGIAAGLASCGKKVFAVSPACFLTARALEQVKNDVAYADHPVKLVGISAGVSYGALGSTHHSLHDFAVLRAIHNLVVMAPADNIETEKAIKLAMDCPKPVYLRFGKKALPLLHHEAIEMKIGRGIMLRDGSDVALIAAGECVVPALSAAELLEAEYGINARVISMFTIKPLDEAMVLEAGRTCGALITVEEHSVNGGLGEACASCLLENGQFLPFRIMGIPDEYTITGSQEEIFTHYHITGGGIAEEAIKLINKKKIS